jgi:hypothetical protein
MNEGAIITSFLRQGTSDHIISFSDNFINYPKGTEDRVCYLHLLKILHEVAFTAIPSVAKRADAGAKNTSPENTGMVVGRRKREEKHGTRMDAGWAWEMDLVGGLVLACENESNPFGKELRLLPLTDAVQQASLVEASLAGNYYEVVLPDAFLAQQLELFDKWKPGQPIPNMRYHPPVQTRIQTRSSSFRARELAAQLPSSSESSAVSYSSKQKRGRSVSTAANAPATKYARKSAALSEGVCDEEEEIEDSEAEEMGEEEYAQLQKVGLALTDGQARLYSQGRKF